MVPPPHSFPSFSLAAAHKVSFPSNAAWTVPQQESFNHVRNGGIGDLNNPDKVAAASADVVVVVVAASVVAVGAAAAAAIIVVVVDAAARAHTVAAIVGATMA